MFNRNHDEVRVQVKTTPENVREAHEGLFRATMNLPDAAAHCGMTQKELKMTFFEYLKYNAQDFEITEDTTPLSRGQKQGASKPVPIPPRPFPGNRVS
tara:strand:+ start:12595 stop:12888 length:294 start_codon:yes stop_codon:yes gene_type:complete